MFGIGWCANKNQACSNFYNASNLTVQIDQWVYPIPPAGYLMDNLNGYSCVMMVAASGFPLYILGDTFLRNYFVAFNYTAPYSLSLAPSVYSPAGELVPYLGIVPTPPTPSPSNTA
jgi:hypothetical protein